MEPSDSPRSPSVPATAAEPHDPEPQDVTPQDSEPQDAGQLSSAQQAPGPQYTELQYNGPQYTELQYTELQYNGPQYNEPPAATSLDPQLTWARPYVDPPAGGPRNGPMLTPRFTPREDVAPDNAYPAAARPGASMPYPSAAGPAPYDGQAPYDGPAAYEARAPYDAQPAGWAPAPPPRPARGGRRQPVRAIIGDEIRVPFIWCEFGTCDATYTHPEALGERDLRARALAAGWRYDALGRRACPSCAQHDPSFWTTRPPAPIPGNWRRAG